MRRWLKEKRVDNLPRASLADEQLDETVIAYIEQEAAKYLVWHENLVFKKVCVKGIPRKVLLRPEDADSRLHEQLFKLGDRVVYVKDSGAVPLDTKGTVVGVLDKQVEVVFDSAIMSGQDLGGRCSEFRGMSLPFHSLINLSVPQFVMSESGKAAPTKKHSAGHVSSKQSNRQPRPLQESTQNGSARPSGKSQSNRRSQQDPPRILKRSV
ncbi:hypothetical protein DM01DRAFT_1040328 [Hesseltinella vesiculosa]|uniref:5'-3' exoribonuclease 1 SH3-like domain-containing protein n=1 Tax=Hesseltinella vesiculosa TaxID=101127 RepID=A0A1X2GHM2_9FUNG|nr:hypothetical protein DM01DRAFT_1040328 [Hesseltinella vesiculosa]